MMFQLTCDWLSGKMVDIPGRPRIRTRHMVVWRMAEIPGQKIGLAGGRLTSQDKEDWDNMVTRRYFGPKGMSMAILYDYANCDTQNSCTHE